MPTIKVRPSALPGISSPDRGYADSSIASLLELNNLPYPIRFKTKDNPFMKKGREAEKVFLDFLGIPDTERQVKGEIIIEGSSSVELLGSSDALVDAKRYSVLELSKKLGCMESFVIDQHSRYVIEFKDVNGDSSFKSAKWFYKPQLEAYSYIFSCPVVLVVGFEGEYHLFDVIQAKEPPEAVFIAKSLIEAYMAVFDPRLTSDARQEKFADLLGDFTYLTKFCAPVIAKKECFQTLLKMACTHLFETGSFVDGTSYEDKALGFLTKATVTMPTHSIKASAAGLRYLQELGNPEYLTTTGGSPRFNIKSL